MYRRNIVFSADGYRLHGVLHRPAASRPPVVIGSHGLLSSRESPKQRRLAERCTALGVAFLRFDHRGCGRSQGYFPEVTSLKARVRDLRSAIALIRRRGDLDGSIGLFGSSMGGAVCLALARSAGIDALVTVAAPLRSANLRLPEHTDSVPAATQPSFDLSGTAAGIRNLLIVHGDADEVVPFANAEELYQIADSPKQLIRLENGDHRMGNAQHQQRFLQEASQWLAARLTSKRNAAGGSALQPNVRQRRARSIHG